MKNRVTLAACTLAAFAAAGCASFGKSPPQASATLAARSGSAVSGEVLFYQEAGALRVEAKLSGLPAGAHGFHIHEVGDCTAPDAASAKGHFNPAARAHGAYNAAEHHAGDMPNLAAGASGVANASFTLAGVALDGANGIVGRSVVVHADPDDYASQPAGNSGKRIACGVIAAR